MMKPFLAFIRLFFAYAFLLMVSVTFAQEKETDKFEKEYRDMIMFINRTEDSLQHVLISMGQNPELTDIQKARINLLLVRVKDLFEPPPEWYSVHYPDFDSSQAPSILVKAVNFIIQAHTTTGITLIQEYLDTANLNSDSAIYASIYLAEAYRKIGEKNKGIDIVYDQLRKKGISQENLAFAYNRLAAMYQESSSEKFENKGDSTLKYSNLCIEIASKNGYYFHLATAQNELAFYYYTKGDYALALSYGQKAYDNYIKLDNLLYALNTRLNMVRVYIGKEDYGMAIKILHEIEEKVDNVPQRNLLIDTYLLLSDVYAINNDYRKALEYLRIARVIQIDLIRSKIKEEIYEMTAKYDLQEKKNKILEEQRKNKISQQQIQFLSIIALISIALILVLLFIIKFRNKAYKALLRQNLQSKRLDEQMEACIKKENIPEYLPGDLNKEDEKYYHLGRRLVKFFIEEKPYLYEDLSMEDVCKNLNTNRTYLSKAMQIYFNESFNDVLFHYRVKAARQLLSDPGKSHISIEGIGKMAGFKSSSVFFKRFKEMTGLTPNYYRNNWPGE